MRCGKGRGKPGAGGRAPEMKALFRAAGKRPAREACKEFWHAGKLCEASLPAGTEPSKRIKNACGAVGPAGVLSYFFQLLNVASAR